MTYATLSKYIRILWNSARYGWDVDATYREWITGRVLDKLTVAGLMADDALDQYRDHLAFDYRLDQVEGQRFRFWWGHVVDKGFDAGNPLANLHRPKVTKVFHVYRPGQGRIHGEDVTSMIRVVIYGRAITGMPAHDAVLIEEPRDAADQEWLDTYLPTYLARGAVIRRNPDRPSSYSDSRQEK